VGVHEHITEFAGLPVVDWEAETCITAPADTMYRLALTWEDSEEGKRWTDGFAAFLDDPAVGETRGLVVGNWRSWARENRDSAGDVVEVLVAAHERLPQLTALFFGDIISEEQEISWIEQTDISPLFHAYSNLEHFCVRGSNGLSLGHPSLPRLKSLTVQCGGLPVRVLNEIYAAQLPELEHLELWLGEDNYGADITLADLTPLLSGDYFPRLRYLGLRDSEIADQIATAIANAPVLERIRILDLSLGTLTDDGAAALLASTAVNRLQKLDLHYHYCSEEMVAQLMAMPIDVDASDRQEADDDDGEPWRYVAVSE
jgi:hypothetical protein